MCHLEPIENLESSTNIETNNIELKLEKGGKNEFPPYHVGVNLKSINCSWHLSRLLYYCN